jgi:hypothetical protein
VHRRSICPGTRATRHNGEHELDGWLEHRNGQRESDCRFCGLSMSHEAVAKAIEEVMCGCMLEQIERKLV